MANRIICIGRQFGSGGHEIAVKVANQLGIRVYERELIRKGDQPPPVPDGSRGQLSRPAWKTNFRGSVCPAKPRNQAFIQT